ncbi:MAG: DNA polymerase III subunit beta [Anaerolineae bacterium]
MRVSVLQENLARALGVVSRGVASRPTQSVLGNVLLTTEDGRLRLSAINLDQGISITERVNANVEAEGAITVPAREFLEIVNILPPAPVDLEVDARTETLVIKAAGKAANKLKGIDAEQFPQIPEFDADASMSVPAEALQEMINQVVFAAAKEDNRPILQGILTKFDGNHISMVAADGFRMALRTTELNEAVDKPFTLVIPARTLAEIARIAPGDDHQIHISIPPGRSQVMFHLGDVDIVSQLIDGKFPDVEHLIPKTSATSTIMGTKELTQACKNAEIMARNASNTTRFSIKPGRNTAEPGAVTVSAVASERGENEWTLDANIEGQSLDVAFNIRYVLDVLAVIKEEQVALETNGPASPGLLRPAGRLDFTYVIMPMSTR